MTANHGGASVSEYVKVAQLQPQLTGVNIHVIVLELGQLIRTAQGDTIQTLRVADPTGSVNLSLRHADFIEMFVPSDIIKIKNGYTNVHRGSLTLNCGRVGECTRIGEFFMMYSDLPNMSEYNAQYAAAERARKGSPPEEGEVPSAPVDPRRNPGGRGGFGGHRRTAPYVPSGASSGPPAKRPDGRRPPN